MNTAQYHGQMPPKKTRQRYRLGVDEGDLSHSRTRGPPSPTFDAYPTQPYPDPLNYGGSMPNMSASMSQQPQQPQNGHSQQPQGERRRPPSYEAGSRSQEQALNRDDPQQRQRSQTQPQPQQQGGPRPQPSGARAPSHRSSLSAPQNPNPNPNPMNTSNAGASIARLKTPSVMDSVLQPLSLKVQEYDRLMHEAEQDMQRLDEELRALQNRRNDAEARFLDAQSRHEDWQQQYISVERTLKGEPSVPALPQEHQPKAQAALAQQQQQPMPYNEEDDYDDEEDEPPHNERPWSASHQGSFASNKSKSRVRDRLRKSIFGS